MNIPVRPMQPSEQSAEDRLLTFAEDQIEKMKKHAKLQGSSGSPGFYELNEALMGHETVRLGLVALNTVAKIEAAKAKEQFDQWFAERYIEIRNDLNPRSVSATKWYSTREIEMEVRVRFKDEYKKLNEAALFAEHKVATIRRIIDGWQNHQFTLSRLSRNVEAEVMSAKMDSRSLSNFSASSSSSNVFADISF